MAISSVSSNSALTLIDSPNSSASSNSAGLASTAVDLSGDSGVLVFLGASAPSGDSATQLYTALVNAGNASSSAAATATPAADPTTADSTDATDATAAAASTATTNSADTSPSPSNLNADWSTILQSNPSLSALVDGLSVQQALVDTFA